MQQALVGARIFDGENIIDDHALIMEDDRILAVRPKSQIRGNTEVVNLPGGLLAPGFIDVQVNGGGGVLFNATPTLQGAQKIAAAHRKFGTTGMLPTVITDKPEVITAAIRALEKRSPGILGIHVEGPHLDVARKGAHDPQFIRPLTDQDIKELTSTKSGVTMVTLAPNKVSPPQIKALASKGVRVSLGHSDATYAEAASALSAGATAFTHLFNAMSQLTGREAGMVGAALNDDKSFIGIIADGHHVSDAALRIAFAATHHSRFMLISDAMPTAAGGPDHFELMGRTVARKNGKLQLQDGTLAGSNLTMDEALRYVVQVLQLPLESALNMASKNPALFLGLGDELGQLKSNFRASIVHLNDALEVQHTWVDGR